jgi:cysteine desulfurase
MMEKKSAYFDNAASTRVDPKVVEAMLPYFHQAYGNPSSLHSAGREARRAVDEARTIIAHSIGAEPEEIIFTSGGTEANNLAIKGMAFAWFRTGKHIIVSAIEHDCVLNGCRWLKSLGFEIDLAPVDKDGVIRTDRLEELMRPDTILVSVIHANNEIGTIQPVAEIGAICRRHGIPIHSDASQSFGRIPLSVHEANLDLATINSHKIYGPKGVGALFVRKRTLIAPLLHGGGHEQGLRSSTENVPGIVGFAHAARLSIAERESEALRLAALRDRIIDRVIEKMPTAYLNGHRQERLPNNVNFGFHGLEGEAIKLLLMLDELGIEVSSGSACSANDSESKPSHVLVALGRNQVEARGALRITLGRFTTEDHVEYLIRSLFNAIQDLKPIISNP